MIFLSDLDALSRLRQEAIPSISGYYCSCGMSEAMVETIIGTVSAQKIQKRIFGVFVTRVSDCDALGSKMCRLSERGIGVITWLLIKLSALRNHNVIEL